LKFTPENGHIHSRLNYFLKENVPYIQLTISDDGIGISAEHAQNIFDRFYKTDVHHTGSGIGLALVKAFVELQGGTIQVKSKEKKGTTFILEIPAYPSTSQTTTKTEQTAAELPQPKTEENKVEPFLLKEASPAKGSDDDNKADISTGLNPDKETILVIDDNQDICHYITQLLSEHYTLIEAHNGKEGLNMAMKYVPDLIISDIMMPEMDGIECCRHLKTELQTSHIPVILLTACSLDEQRISGFENGADSYISKPFNSQLLVTRIRNLLDNRNRLKQFFGDATTLSKESVSHTDKDFITKFRRQIELNLSNSDLSVEDLGEQMGLSRVQLYRKIKALTNYSPNELLRIARLKKAASLLSSTEKTIAEITYEVGFTSPSYFTKCYKEYFGENPTELIKRKK
jgi:DNA-binding response OmpR family regulator